VEKEDLCVIEDYFFPHLSEMVFGFEGERDVMDKNEKGKKNL